MHGHLSWFASPLHAHDHGESKEEKSHGSTDGGSNDGYNPVKLTATDTQNVPFDNNDGALHETPAFHRHAEATTAELFYDLFFVANLTTFTSLLEINDSKALSAYIGFFCLLWFTWYQTSLYDVRFAADSVFERCCKAVHFGVMVGFAVMGPDWKPGQAANDYSKFRAFSYILMVSRFVLVGQYASTLFFTWNYRRTRLPIMMVMASYVVAAILYGGLSAAFPNNLASDEVKSSNVYVAWYVVAVGETLLTTAVSCYWRVISFKGTHLIQRMSLLTLIILGEGIIVICKAISYIVKNQYIFTSSVIGQIVASILIIYFLYMLYFDRLREDHFGTIKQQIWAFLHFPLHITLVLVLEGVSNFVTWRQAVEGVGYLDSSVTQLLDDISDPSFPNNATLIIDDFTDLAYTQVFDWVPKGIDVTAAKETVSNALSTMYDRLTANLTDTELADDAQFNQSWNDYYFTLINTLLESLAIKAPDKKSKDGSKPDAADTTDALFKVFDLVFIYFFVTAGLSLIVMGTLAVLSEKPKTLGAYLRNGSYFIVGLALCLLSLMKYTGAESQFAFSPWVLPTLCLSLFAVVVINYLKRKPKTHDH